MTKRHHNTDVVFVFYACCIYRPIMYGQLFGLGELIHQISLITPSCWWRSSHIQSTYQCFRSTKIYSQKLGSEKREILQYCNKPNQKPTTWSIKVSSFSLQTRQSQKTLFPTVDSSRIKLWLHIFVLRWMRRHYSLELGYNKRMKNNVYIF